MKSNFSGDGRGGGVGDGDKGRDVGESGGDGDGEKSRGGVIREHSTV